MQAITGLPLTRKEDGKPSDLAEKELRSIHIKMKSSASASETKKDSKEEQQQLGSHSQAIEESLEQKIESKLGIPKPGQAILQNPPYFTVNDNRDSSVVVEIGSKCHHNNFDDHFEHNQVLNTRVCGEQKMQAPQNRLVTMNWNFECTIFSLLFTLLVGCGIVLLVLTEQIWLIIIAGVLYALECVFTGFLQIFYTPITQEEFNQLYQDVLNDEPSISVKATSFKVSFKQKNQQVSPPIAQNNSSKTGGNTAITIAQKIEQISSNPIQNVKPSQFIRVREEIFSDQKSFDFKSSIDYSHPLHKSSQFFEKEGILYIELVIDWTCANDNTKIAFQKLKTEVISNAKTRSEDIEYSEIARVVQFPSCKRCLVLRPSHFKSKLFNQTAYTIFSVFLMSFFYRIYYLNTIKTLQLNIAKKISI